MSKRRIPNTYVIIACIIALCAAATWFVPGGEYVKAEDGSLVYHSVDAVLLTDFSTLLLSFFSSELHTSCSSEDCTSSLNNISYASAIHIVDFFIKKSHVTLLDTLNV